MLGPTDRERREQISQGAQRLLDLTAVLLAVGGIVYIITQIFS